ncbi:MAG: UDP-N-acetylmuramoyl-tripeptide--D-alanyl-D-alanine ligase [Planctomycetota bacterium]|nr:MAG: UDP-N-acetylmuramoyl-tripeptide--D-alanyl-D-alanine ligase [Planctomycetota bacterium]
MTFWNPDTIRAVVSGTWVTRPRENQHDPFGVTIDSRQARPGQVFVALRGERTEGHRFVGRAAERGCPLAIVEHTDEPLPDSIGIIRVESTIEALGRLAAAYRRSALALRVIAVTGSCGKTTTVRLIDAVLSQRLRGSASPRSFNNAIGVPLTLLNARPSDNYVVCEVGTNAPGEIETLARICEPDVAVITNIGRAHLERLGSVDGVAREKASLLAHLRGGGLAFVPAECGALHRHIRLFDRERLVTIGVGPEADLRVTGVVASPAGVRFSLNDRVNFEVPLLGEHNAINAAIAVGVGRRLGLGDEEIRAGLSRARGAEMRGQLVRLGPVTVINDAYNANPESMIAGLKVLATWRDARRVAVLGDMLELGDAALSEHRIVGEWMAAARAAEVVVLVGPLAREMLGPIASAIGEESVHWFETLDGSSCSAVSSLIEPGDVVLLKGSRRMGLERIAADLERRFVPDITSTSGDRASTRG